MKNFNMMTILVILFAFLGPVNICAQDAVDALNQLERIDRPGILVRTLDEMLNEILKNVGERNFTAHQFLGFSGASFLDLERYKSEFRKRVLELSQNTLKKYGKEAKTVYILGGSLDGFGIGYKILKELIDSGRIQNALVTGMVSNAVIAYHLEGLEKGWGHVISPDQEITMFKQTFIDSKGNPSWELKSTPQGESDTPRILKDLSRYSNAGQMSFNVFGGGAQAFNETLEMILESRNRPNQIDIHLYNDHQPGKAKKDTGYRAANMLSYVLANNTYLLNKKINIKIKQLDSPRKVSLGTYRNSKGHSEMAYDLERADTELIRLKTLEATPEVQARINYFEVLRTLDKLPLKELENFRYRSSLGISEARDAIKNSKFTETVLIKESVLDRLDSCQRCLEDIEEIQQRFHQVKSCKSSAKGRQ